MDSIVRTLSETKGAFSQEDLDSALGNTALEGLKPTSAALKDLQKVVVGTLSVDQYVKRAKSRHGV